MLGTVVGARSTVVNKTEPLWWPPGYVHSMACGYLRFIVSKTGTNIFLPKLVPIPVFPISQTGITSPIAQFRNWGVMLDAFLFTPYLIMKI